MADALLAGFENLTYGASHCVGEPDITLGDRDDGSAITDRGYTGQVDYEFEHCALLSEPRPRHRGLFLESFMSAKDRTDIPLKVSVTSRMWREISLITEIEDYTLSEYVRELIRRDIRSRNAEIFSRVMPEEDRDD